MNKSEMKWVMEQIEKKLKGQKSISYIEHQNKLQWRVLEELWDGGHKKYNFNDVHYNIMYNPSHPTHGNRSTTPDFTVSRYSKKEHFDADEVLEKKEIEIRDWFGGDKRIAELGYSTQKKFPVSDLLGMIEHILDVSLYNIMIQRHETGDVTIWITNGKFTQQ